MRIGHCADLHLGYAWGDKRDPETGRNQRSVDFERSFAACVDGVLAEGVDLVLIAGDIFHSPKPSWAAVAAFVAEMQRLRDANIPVVAICGNHDMPRLRQPTAFDLLAKALPGVEFAAGYEPVVLGTESDAYVHCVPHGALVAGDTTVFPRSGRLNILLTHGDADGLPLAVDREPGEIAIGPELLADDWDYVALGHYHGCRGVGKNGWYSGSTERVGFSDEPTTPGWLLVELNGGSWAVSPREVPCRPMVTLPEVNCAGRDWSDVRAEIERVAGVVHPGSVRSETNARIPLAGASHAIRAQAQRLLADEREFGFWTLRIAVPRARKTATVLREPDEGALGRRYPVVEDLFREYVEAQGYDKRSFPEGFGERFAERGLAAIVRAGDEARERAEGE